MDGKKRICGERIGANNHAGISLLYGVCIWICVTAVSVCMLCGCVSTVNSAKSCIKKGNSESEKGNYLSAVQWYTRALELNPTDSWVLNERGNMYFFLSEYEQAIADYTESLQLQSSDAIVYTNRGNAYYMLAEYKKAVSDYTMSLRLAPGNSETYFFRGQAYDCLGKSREAIKSVARAIELDANGTLDSIYGYDAFLQRLYKKTVSVATDTATGPLQFTDPSEWYDAVYFGYTWEETSRYCDIEGNIYHYWLFTKRYPDGSADCSHVVDTPYLDTACIKYAESFGWKFDPDYYELYDEYNEYIGGLALTPNNSLARSVRQMMGKVEATVSMTIRENGPHDADVLINCLSYSDKDAVDGLPVTVIYRLYR